MATEVLASSEVRPSELQQDPVVSLECCKLFSGSSSPAGNCKSDSVSSVPLSLHLNFQAPNRELSATSDQVEATCLTHVVTSVNS